MPRKTARLEQPSVLPLDGHRGAIYLGDLIRLVSRACTRPQWTWAFHPLVTRPYWEVISPDTVGIYVGTTEKVRGKLRPGQGCLGAAKHGMIPEFPILANPNDPESEVVCNGWRNMIRIFLVGGFIHPTEEVRALLGPVSYTHRYYAPVTDTLYVPIPG